MGVFLGFLEIPRFFYFKNFFRFIYLTHATRTATPNYVKKSKEGYKLLSPYTLHPALSQGQFLTPTYLYPYFLP